MSVIDGQLQALGIVLPVPAKPLASYLPWRNCGNLVFISGQLPLIDGKPLWPGTVPSNVSIESAMEAARQCAIHIIAHLRDACRGDLDRVAGIVKLTGFVASTAQFADHPRIINGASDLMLAVFGDQGRHARAAVGVASLPMGSSVEIEAIAELK